MVEIEDETLLKKISNKDELALNLLIKKYTPLINFHVNRYLNKATFLGLDYYDLYQEGLMGLTNAAKNFKEENNAKFKTFASILIYRQIQDIIKIYNRNNNVTLNEAVSLDEKDEDNKDLYEKISTTAYIPEDSMLASELDLEIKTILAPLEFKVYELKKDGKSNKDISLILNLPVKSIENSIGRIKNKVRNLL